MYEWGRASGERLFAEADLAYALGDPEGDSVSSADIGESRPRRSIPGIEVEAGLVSLG